MLPRDELRTCHSVRGQGTARAAEPLTDLRAHCLFPTALLGHRVMYLMCSQQQSGASRRVTLRVEHPRCRRVRWRANAPCPEVARASFRFLPPDTQPRPWSQSWCRRNPSGMGTGPVRQHERPRRLRGEPPARAPAQRGLYLVIPLPVPPHSPRVNGECSRRATFQMTRVYVDSDRQPC